MTEVEFSRLLSELSVSAKVLNERSNSINAVIARFERALKEANVGLEAWLVDDPLHSSIGPSEDGEVSKEIELGYTKVNQEWCLAVRGATYKKDDDGDWSILVSEGVKQPLRDSARVTRIDALKRFPRLAEKLKDVADEAIRAIDNAEKFVAPKPSE